MTLMPPRTHMLAIDTTFAACSAAVRVAGPDGGQPRMVERFCEMQTGHAEQLMPMVRSVLDEAGLTFRDLKAIAVTIGPGSFTGTRIGVAAARAYALAGGLPVFGATSLAAIAAAAWSARAGLEQPIAPDAVIDVCVDARRDQIYRQVFADPAMEPLTDPGIISVADAATDQAFTNSAFAGRRRVLVGSAAPAVASALAADSQNYEVLEQFSLPRAAMLLNAHLVELDPPSPLYLRPPDAKVQSGKAIPRRKAVSEA